MRKAFSGSQDYCHGLPGLHHVMRIAWPMDMSFARRRKNTPDPATPSLPVLLADISARQGASRTAAVHLRLQSPSPEITADPLVDIFAPVGQPIAAIHRFSDQIDEQVKQSKLK
jgi:hypothetical protein